LYRPARLSAAVVCSVALIKFRRLMVFIESCYVAKFICAYCWLMVFLSPVLLRCLRQTEKGGRIARQHELFGSLAGFGLR